MTTIQRIAPSRSGHPFRQTVLLEARRRREDGDLKLFVVSFTAFFIAIGVFIL